MQIIAGCGIFNSQGIPLSESLKNKNIRVNQITLVINLKIFQCRTKYLANRGVLNRPTTFHARTYDNT